MLSEEMVAILAGMPYQPDAEWEVNILPFGSIYWKDEMPAITDLVKHKDDMAVILAMFGIRLKLWDGEALSGQEQETWNAVERQAPHWALFRRLRLSDEQRLARQEAERRVEREFESLSSDDEATEQ